MTSLIDAVNTASTKLAPTPKTLVRPSVKYKDGIPDLIVTGPASSKLARNKAEYLDAVRSTCGVDIPEGYELQLVEAWHTESAWTRAELDQELAVTKPTWRYKFKVVPVAFYGSENLPSLQRYVKSRRASQKPALATTVTDFAEVVNLADLQIGKRDERGGTEEFLARFFDSMDRVVKRIRASKPQLIVLTELGDGCENFQNVPTQAQSNDRNLIAQLDLHAMCLTYAATELAKLAPKLIVVGVPSNHMEVRENGKAVGGPDNDYGLLALSQLKRSFELNPKAFGHVEFAWPGEYEVSVVLDVMGTNVMFTHGHYARGAGAADSVPKWLEHQFAAEEKWHAARVVFTGHYHHLRIQQIIGGRWWLQAPALDNGSAWLKRVNGQGSSDAGILVVRIDSNGWSRQEVL